MNHWYNFLQTSLHKFWVVVYMLNACRCLMWRAIIHDLSKYSRYEAPLFASNIFKLKHTVYSTPEYQKLLDEIRPALIHHYKYNSHHPEFWEHGIEDMNPLDQIELLVDWKSACRRHVNGSLYKSIVSNAKRFNYSENQQKSYIRAAVEMFEYER